MPARFPNQQAGYTKRIGKKFRLENIPVENLQNTGKNDKKQCLFGIYQQQNEGSENTADDWPKVGDQVRNRYNDRDQPDIRHSANQHENRIDDADNQCIQNALPKKTHEDGVAPQREIHNRFVCFLSCHQPQ